MTLIMNRQKILVAMTGASGAPYTEKLLKFLLEYSNYSIYFIYSKAASLVAKLELDWELSVHSTEAKVFLTHYFQNSLERLTVVELEDWSSLIASGSGGVDGMVVCPCSMGTLASLAHGLSANLIERAADVVIKEKKQLILVPRETPVSSIHLANMLQLSQLGVEILPASPGFYNRPQTTDDLITFVVVRILKRLGIEVPQLKKWGDD